MPTTNLFKIRSTLNPKRLGKKHVSNISYPRVYVPHVTHARYPSVHAGHPILEPPDSSSYDSSILFLFFHTAVKNNKTSCRHLYAPKEQDTSSVSTTAPNPLTNKYTPSAPKAAMSAAMNKGRQVMEETQSERQTRSAGSFRNVEEALPKHIGSRWDIPFLDNMGSFLSTLNPLAKAVDPEKEEVWLLDNTAYRPVHVYPHQPQPFQARFTAAYFKRYTGKDWSKAVASIADTIGLADGEGRAQAEKTIAHRLKPFVETIAPARYVDITLPNGTVAKLGPGGRSAVSEQIIVSIQDHKDGDSVEISAIPTELCPHGAMLTHFAEPEGWLMVSGMPPPIPSPKSLHT